MHKKIAAGLLGAGIAFTMLPVSPAAAVCTWSPDPVFGTCNPCQVVGLAYGPADHATGGKVLPTLNCLA